MILAMSGLAYGVVDVMEDIVLARILGTSSAISGSRAAGARALTRLKMLTLTISLSGLVLFIALGIIRSVFRTDLVPRLHEILADKASARL